MSHQPFWEKTKKSSKKFKPWEGPVVLKGPIRYSETDDTDKGEVYPTDFQVTIRREEWAQAFTSSRDSILRNHAKMERIRAKRTDEAIIRAARIEDLGQALDVVSQPIDINAPPPAAAPIPQGS